MPRCISPLRKGWVLGALFVVSMLGFASTASAQFDRGTISGTIKDASGGVVPGVTVTATSVQTQTPTVAVTDATGFYTFPNLRPGVYVVNAELQGFKKIVRENVQLDASASVVDRLRARDRCHHRAGDGHRRDPAAAVRRDDPQGRRLEGHRAAVLLGAQPHRRGQPQARRGGRVVQHARLRRSRQRRLQHQRQPQRREQHHRRRRDGRAHPVDGRDHRHSERRCHSGSAGPDGELHAGVRPQQRRADPVRHQERQQPLQRQRVVLLPGRLAQRQQLVP